MLTSETEKYQIATANYQDGFEDGVVKGEAQGIEKGEAQGMEKQALEDARNFKKFGVAEEIIMQAMGLTAEQVQAL